MRSLIFLTVFLVSCHSNPVVVKNVKANSQLLGLALNPPQLLVRTTNKVRIPNFVLKASENGDSYTLTENDIVELIYFTNTSNAAIAERNKIIDILNLRLVGIQREAITVLDGIASEAK